jgi:hypothetical protein
MSLYNFQVETDHASERVAIANAYGEGVDRRRYDSYTYPRMEKCSGFLFKLLHLHLLPPDNFEHRTHKVFRRITVRVKISIAPLLGSQGDIFANFRDSA